MGVVAAKALMSAFAEGPTELRDVFLRLGGRDGEVSFPTVVVMEYSSWFHPKNSLILPIVFLVLIEGDYDFRQFSFQLFSKQKLSF